MERELAAERSDTQVNVEIGHTADHRDLEVAQGVPNSVVRRWGREQIMKPSQKR